MEVDDVSPSVLPVLSGVPQGNIPGPLLFLVYVNNPPDSISLSSSYMFVDDTKLIKIISTPKDPMTAK